MNVVRHRRRLTFLLQKLEYVYHILCSLYNITNKMLKSQVYIVYSSNCILIFTTKNPSADNGTVVVCVNN